MMTTDDRKRITGMSFKEAIEHHRQKLVDEFDEVIRSATTFRDRLAEAADHDEILNAISPDGDNVITLPTYPIKFRCGYLQGMLEAEREGLCFRIVGSDK